MTLKISRYFPVVELVLLSPVPAERHTQQSSLPMQAGAMPSPPVNGYPEPSSQNPTPYQPPDPSTSPSTSTHPLRPSPQPIYPTLNYPQQNGWMYPPNYYPSQPRYNTTHLDMDRWEDRDRGRYRMGMAGINRTFPLTFLNLAMALDRVTTHHPIPMPPSMASRPSLASRLRTPSLNNPYPLRFRMDTLETLHTPCRMATHPLLDLNRHIRLSTHPIIHTHMAAASDTPNTLLVQACTPARMGATPPVHHQ